MSTSMELKNRGRYKAFYEKDDTMFLIMVVFSALLAYAVETLFPMVAVLLIVFLVLAKMVQAVGMLGEPYGKARMNKIIAIWFIIATGAVVAINSQIIAAGVSVILGIFLWIVFAIPMAGILARMVNVNVGSLKEYLMKWVGFVKGV